MLKTTLDTNRDRDLVAKALTHLLDGDDMDFRSCAIPCAHKVQHLITDERSLHALDLAEKYTNGLADDDELIIGCATASVAARSAV